MGQAQYPGQPVTSTGNYPYNPTGAGSGAQPTQNDATRMIQQLLTSPRPQGLPGSQTTGGMQFGAGIAGVATTVEDEGIMVYEEHTKYNQWEFIYDPAKDKTGAGRMQTQGPGTPANQLNNPQRPATGAPPRD